MTDPTTPQHDQPVEGSRSDAYTRPDDGNLGGPDTAPGAADMGAGTAKATATEYGDSTRVVPLLRTFSYTCNRRVKA